MGKSTPCYVVCSPCRGVGKTLLARLIAEIHPLDGRPAAAFDLADEGPRLLDFLPQSTTAAGIANVTGQMRLFEGLLACGMASVIDVSHREFERFFTVVEEIGFFEEARRRAIEPLIVFIIDADPRSPRAYARLRDRFTEASLLPVCNRIGLDALSDNSPRAADALPPALEIPLLDFALQAMIDQAAFSFCDFWRSPPPERPVAMNRALRDWLEDVLWQLRIVEHSLAWDGGAPVSSPRPLLQRQPRGTAAEDRPPMPYEVRKFAPRKLRAGGVGMEESAGIIVDMLKSAGDKLRAAEDRIGELESEVEHLRDRAVRAEGWLERLRQEIEQKLVRPAGVRSGIDDLSS
jgi:hypothetical protein